MLRMKMGYFLRFGLAALLLSSSPSQTAQAAGAAAAGSEAEILECGLSAFSENDDRLFGQVYVLSRHRSPPNAPDGRDQVFDREDEQIAICGRQHHLSAKDAHFLDTYTKGEMLRRGAAWDLRNAGVDPTRLHQIAKTLSPEDFTRHSNDGLIRRLRPALEEAGVPKSLHAASVDYIVFTCRHYAARWLWARQRAGRR
jgi:hypothetical protein